MNERLTEILKAHPSIRLAILFGSRANHSHSPHSDIDLAIHANNAVTSDFKWQLISEIGGEFALPVDLVDLKTAGHPLLGEILQGKKLFGDTGLHASYISKNLIDAADFLPLQQRILKERREKWINS